MFNKFRKIAIANRLEDQVLFEYVLEELENGIKIKGLWAKAYANSEGDSNKIEPLYMQYRVQSIKDIFTTLKIAYEELPKETIANYLKNYNLSDEEKEELRVKEEKLLKEKEYEENLKAQIRLQEEEQRRIIRNEEMKEQGKNFLAFSIVIGAFFVVFVIFKGLF